MVRSPYTISFSDEEEREILRHANILVCLSAKKRKRHRTSPEQLSILETMFKSDRTPDFETRAILSKQLGMTPRRIQIWFQNKRAKVKKLKEGPEGYNFSDNTTSSMITSNPSSSPNSSDNDNESNKSSFELFSSSPLPQLNRKDTIF